MVDIWEDMFGIDIEEGPQLGLVDISEVHFSIFKSLIISSNHNTLYQVK